MPKLEDEDKSGEEKSDRYHLRTEEQSVRTPFMGRTVAPKAETCGKRRSKWVSFARQHCAFGFEKLTNAQLPQMSHRAYGLAICLEKIRGWKLPRSLLKDLNRGSCDVSVHLRLSLFHMKSLTFFGTTWIGPEILLNDNEVPDVLEYIDIVYLISRLIDNSCIGIIEVVATRVDRETNLATAQYGCGWAMLSLFGQHVLHDVSEGFSHVSATTAAFYRGSPRDILELSLHDQSRKPALQEMNGCLLHFKIYSHRKLLKISDLIMENAIFGRFDTIAGLAVKKVAPLPGEHTISVPCIGDQKVEEEGVLIMPGVPSVARSYMAKVTNFKLIIPNRASFESALVTLAGQGLSSTSASAQIISRVAKIAYHNGHTLVTGSFQEYTLEKDDTDNDTLKTADGTIELSGYVAHELFALVVVIEYAIGVTDNRDVQHSFKSIQTSALQPKDETVTISIGTSIFVPFSDGKIHLRNGLMDTDRESVADVELNIITDTTCGIVSPHKVFRTSDYLRAPDDEDLPKIRFDLKMFDWHNREIFHDHEDGRSAFASESEEDFDSISSEVAPSHEITKHRERPHSDSDSDSDSTFERVDRVKPSRNSLKLDQEYYTTKRPDRMHEPNLSSSVKVPSSSSLMLRSMKINLDDRKNENIGTFLNDKVRITQPVSMRPLIESTKEISRASRARLNRHGFHAGIGTSRSSVRDHSSIYGLDNLNVDISRESRDRLSLNEITIQFAGYRGGSSSEAKASKITRRLPRAIYCSYQFYTCTHTRTEPVRILPSEVGEIGVLVRDTADSRNDPPLVLSHIVDCCDVSTLEAFEFANYLGHCKLYIDVWDADSLLLIGVCAVPLRRLMRQGQKVVKCAIECDIVDSDPGLTNADMAMNIMSNGPVVGTVVGSLNIILGSTGHESLCTTRIAEAKSSIDSELNWRVNTESSKLPSSRSKNQVRARPLSESQPKLSNLLEEHKGVTASKAPMRSLWSSRTTNNDHTITYDELSRLFKRFEGTIKGTIQYSGSLLTLLDVPSMESAKVKFLKAVVRMKRTGGSLKTVNTS